MKMSEVRARLVSHNGFRVHFERREGGMLHSDFFPDRDEPAIADEEDAWRLAGEWAAIEPTTFVNVYVIQAWNYVPVANYAQRRLNTYQPVFRDPR